VRVGNGWEGGACFNHLLSCPRRKAAGPPGKNRGMLSISFSSLIVSLSSRPRKFKSFSPSRVVQ